MTSEVIAGTSVVVHARGGRRRAAGAVLVFGTLGAMLSASSAGSTVNQTRSVQEVPSRVPALPEARRLIERGDLEGARRILDLSLRGRPDHVEALVERGNVRFKLGELEGARADYERATELQPELLPYLWQRGIVLYYLEAWEECLDQFERHRTVNPDDVENAAWHFLCAARRDGVQAARRGLLPVGPDSRVPLPEIYGLYAGETDAEAVLAVAERPSDAMARRTARFYAHLYLGLFAEVLGDEATAREHLLRASEQRFPHFMGDVVRIHLKEREGTSESKH